MRVWPRAVALFAAVAVALVAGCGGEELTKEQYVAEAAAPIGEVDAALAAIEAAPPDTVAAEAEQARGSLLAAATELEAIDPPEELREAHALLVDGIRGLAGEVEDAVATGPTEEIPETVERIRSLSSLEKLEQAQARFDQEDVTLEIGVVAAPTAPAATGSTGP